MPAKIFFLSVLMIALGWLLVPIARYLIWGANVETEIISVPAPAGFDTSTPDLRLELLTLLGRDAIAAILDPQFVTPFEAEQWMEPDERVLGLSLNGEHKAYPIKMLSRDEVVNDVVGGEPVTLTW